MQKFNFKTLKKSAIKSVKSIINMLPIIIGIVLLVGLLKTFVPNSFYAKIFIGNKIIDSITGAFFGSILAGNPITSYILGGEMLKQGIALVVVISFLIAWVTVGIVQIPLEIKTLGKKFAITRNIIAFFSAIIIAIITTILVVLI